MQWQWTWLNHLPSRPRACPCSPTTRDSALCALTSPPPLFTATSSADFFVSATYLVDASLPLPHERRCPDALCYVLASSTQFFSLSSIIWTAIICHAVYR